MNLINQFVIFIFIALSLSSCYSLETSSMLATEYYNLGNTYFELKKYAEAARAYKTALAFQPDLQVSSINFIRSLIEQGDAESALATLKSLEEKNKDNLNLLKIRAYLLYIKGDRQEAWSLWSDLVTKLPGDLDTLYNASLAAFDQKKYDQALKLLQDYASLDGKTPDAYLLLGELQRQKKDWKKAEEAYRTVLKLDEKNILAQKTLAEVLMNRELYGEAVDAYLLCIKWIEDKDEKDKKKPFDPSLLLFQVAKIQLQLMENYEEAWKNFQKAQEKGSLDDNAWKKLLDVPDLYEKIRLQADLKLANIYPKDDKNQKQPQPSKDT